MKVLMTADIRALPEVELVLAAMGRMPSDHEREERAAELTPGRMAAAYRAAYASLARSVLA